MQGYVFGKVLFCFVCVFFGQGGNVRMLRAGLYQGECFYGAGHADVVEAAFFRVVCPAAVRQEDVFEFKAFGGMDGAEVYAAAAQFFELDQVVIQPFFQVIGLVLCRAVIFCCVMAQVFAVFIAEILKQGIEVFAPAGICLLLFQQCFDVPCGKWFFAGDNGFFQPYDLSQFVQGGLAVFVATDGIGDFLVLA